MAVTYLAGAEESLVVDLCFLLEELWCFLLCDLVGVAEGDAAGVEAGGSAASTGPAIRARATTGMSFLNIDESPKL